MAPGYPCVKYNPENSAKPQLTVNNPDEETAARKSGYHDFPDGTDAPPVPKSTPDKDRIAALEAENAALKAERESLQKGPAQHVGANE